MPDAGSFDDDVPTTLAILLENHRAFLKYLERRVGNRAVAEDILQDAFAKVLDHPNHLPPDEDEGVVRWFYRVLRNAAIDHFRRRGTASQAIEAFARELDAHVAPEPDMGAEICACVMRLARTLKPEYAEALQAIDVEGTPARTGKPRGLDLRDGNPSLPIVLALELDAEVRRIFGLEQPTATDVETGLARIRRSRLMSIGSASSASGLSSSALRTW